MNLRGEANYALFFESLANKLRINIILCLQQKPMTVGEIAETLKEEQSKISHAMEALRDCRIVSLTKVGRRRPYKLNSSFIKPLLSLVDMHVRKHCASCQRQKSKNKKNSASSTQIKES
ncbi:MAG: metalloregulator ArsR/SmtB family transcription factor [Candidatus Anstonellales archaeon]